MKHISTIQDPAHSVLGSPMWVGGWMDEKAVLLMSKQKSLKSLKN